MNTLTNFVANSPYQVPLTIYGGVILLGTLYGMAGGLSVGSKCNHPSEPDMITGPILGGIFGFCMGVTAPIWVPIYLLS